MTEKKGIMDEVPISSKKTPTSLLPAGSPREDAEIPEAKLKYPKSVFFIISNEFCERFSYYGMRTILAIYLRNVLLYSDDESTIIYHTFTMFCYFFPLLGAMLADSLLGKFRTIFYISIIYAIGNIVISLASASGAIDIPAREVSIVGLLLIAVGTGGIKPCVSAFGGDQFILPQQERQLQQFFSLFYFAINSGSLISTFLTPVLRQDITCLGQESCYPLAFGVPAVLMVVSIIIFLIGKPLYTIKKPAGNIVLKVCKCIGHSISNKWAKKNEKVDSHWLDRADDKYDNKLIEDIKATLRVLLLYLPLPFFWALFDQQGSRWTFQATRMNGDVGGYLLKPDQMQVVNPLLILAFIPLYETVIYPLLGKCNLLKAPLQRLGVGGILAALSFLISAFIEMQLETTYAVLPSHNEAQLRLFNGLNCPVDISNQGAIDLPKSLDGLQMWESGNIVDVSGNISYKMTVNASSCSFLTENEVKTSLNATSNEARSYLISYNIGDIDKKNIVMKAVPSFDIIDKAEDGSPLIRILYNFINNTQDYMATFESESGSKELLLEAGQVSTELLKIEPISYTVKIAETVIGSYPFEQGGVYTLLLVEDPKKPQKYTSNLIVVTSPNSFHMLWLIPQYVVITMGEVMFSITGLEFSFTQAPSSMKSVMQAAWLLTVAFGNLIVVIIAEAKFFDSQANEFFLFAGLMLLDMGVFCLLARKYTYVKSPSEEAEEEENSGLALGPSSEKKGINNETYKSEQEL